MADDHGLSWPVGGVGDSGVRPDSSGVMNAQGSNQGGTPMPKGAKVYRGNDPKLKKQGWVMPPSQPTNPQQTVSNNNTPAVGSDDDTSPSQPINSTPSAPIVKINPVDAQGNMILSPQQQEQMRRDSIREAKSFDSGFGKQ